MTEGPAAANTRSFAGTTDYNISPSYVPGGGDPRLTFSFTLAAELAPSTRTTLLYRNVLGQDVTGTQVLAFSYVGGGLGINLSNTDFDTSPSIFFDGNGNRNSTSFRSTVTTDAAGVVQYYDIQGVSENASVPTLYTGFNVNRTVTVPTLSIGSSGVSLKYRFITGSASCGSNCGSPVFTEMSDVTIPGGGGNGGGGTIIPPGGSTSVPEPASTLLLAAGLALTFYRRRNIPVS